MKLSVTGRHVAVSEAIRTQITRKLARIERRLNDSAVSAQCVLSRERQRIVCELTVHARGDHQLVGVGRHAEVAGAVAAAVEKVLPQAQRLASKWKTRRRRPVRRQAAEAPAVAAPAAPPAPRVVRARRYAVRALTVDDAALALERGDQSFLVFREQSSDAVAVVFRRPDGHIGLIEPGA